MVGILILNVIFLFGLYTAIKFRMQKEINKVCREKDLKALNLISNYCYIRHSKMSASEKLRKLNEFDEACDAYMSDFAKASEDVTGENITRLSDYVTSKEDGLKRAGH